MKISKSNQQGFGILELLIMTATIGLIAFAGWLVFVRKDKPVTTPVSAQQAIVNEISKKVTGQYAFAASDTDAWIAEMGSGASLQSVDYGYSVSTQNFPSAYFLASETVQKNPSPEEFTQKVTAIIENSLVSSGYTKTTGAFTIPSLYQDYDKTTYTPSFAAYNLHDITCLEIYFTNQAYASISCFTSLDIAQSFAAGKPYVDAYVSANSSAQPNSITFGPATVKSKTKSGVISPTAEPGFDLSEAVVTVGGTKKIALYYNEQNGPWKYITQANDEFGFTCGSYVATPVIRKVMYNQICLGSEGQVRLDTNNRALQ
jgi:Tfp pilus assembly protein PilE